MSNLERAKILREYISEEPDNPFNYYALALEIKDIDSGEAGKLFEFLLLQHADYLPVYFPAANFFFELGQISKAKDVFEKGISLAEALRETKTLHELKNSYQNFLFDNDLE
mgnify:CR=1 FL=1